MSSTEKNHTAKKARKTTSRKRAKKTTKRATKRTTKSASKTTAKKTSHASGTNAKSTSHATDTTGRFSLMLLSPYRLPLDVERATTYTARVAGLAFVVAVVFGTYHALESKATEVALAPLNTAAVASAPAARSASSMTPPVSFSYATTPNSSSYSIGVTVKAAKRVELHAYHIESRAYQFIGEATRSNGSVWTYTLDTASLEPGTYWFKAVVTNEHGVYDRSDSRTITISR